MNETRSDSGASPWAGLSAVPSAAASAGGGGSAGGPPVAGPGGGGYQGSRTPSQVLKTPTDVLAGVRQRLGLAPEPQLTLFGAPENTAEALAAREVELIGELQAMGLPVVCIQIATRIGFDAFMEVWRVLDGTPWCHNESTSGLSLNMPKLRAYHRYQRNRFVEALAAMGHTRGEIRAQVRADIGESLSPRHIQRLKGGARR